VNVPGDIEERKGKCIFDKLLFEITELMKANVMKVPLEDL
jgi:hypothetical protein